ncbi:polyprenyl synthetase family protein [Bacillus sp. BRMEA1]|uniref:polyprenyl synthetase family protein n=1 Tax=Neobacillus endophyticus TaxID=2738405 RepID=UPI0015661699|nr:polyprenyl synthetase family protein [Neobacillus endophyticus]NRD79713.1 polyprenyl synthetase family protein [Neobacillus endophyticus]
MNEELIKNADACYQLAEQKAAQYFQTLFEQVSNKTYVSVLTNDFQVWKQQHIHHLPSISLRKKKSEAEGYQHYLQWLKYTGKLDPYLERSISYLFLRDLGKTLDDPDTISKLQRTIGSLKNYITKLDSSEKKNDLNMAAMYRWAQKEKIESAIIWLFDKLRTVSKNIPKGLEAEHAQRKLIKIIAGVMMHALVDMNEDLPPEERRQKLDQAIRLGYSYGLTYPFIDDLLDANILSSQEKQQYSDMIRTTLITGSVPKQRNWMGKNANFMQYIQSELESAFTYIKAQQPHETSSKFFEQAYVFFHSQEVDRIKNLANRHYRNEDLYIPIILKSSSSRLIARSVIEPAEDEGFESRTFFYGLYNQLADDFADMFDDLKDGAVTPYTYYLKHHNQRPDLINPFELYWAVIANLIHDVYHSDPKTREVILNRAINGLKRFKKRIGTQKYHEVMELFSFGNPSFQRLLQKMVRKAGDVDFFDKLLRDHMIFMLKNERKEQQEFLDTVDHVRDKINSLLRIPLDDNGSIMKNQMIEAANYCLEAGGKRLRPIITWVMGVNEYGLEQRAIEPLLKSLEYMHTASLIFDDLPSQDNSHIRRGRPTLHKAKTIAVAELTGLFLTQKAIEEQASLNRFDPDAVLRLIHYSAKKTELMCEGQAMDLDSKGKTLTLQHLNLLCAYKTSIAFEASLIMPAILAKANETEMMALKRFAYHAGIAFQIKDDLLDVEGEMDLMGKPIGKDDENDSSTFVSVLGLEGARKDMWENYCLAIEAWQHIPSQPAFLKHLMNYIVNRSR